MADYEEEFRRILDYKDDEIPYTYLDGRIVPDVDETVGGLIAPIAQVGEIPKLPVVPSQPDVLGKIGTPEERSAAAGLSTPGYEEKFKNVLSDVLSGIAGAAEEIATNPEIVTGLAQQTGNIAMAIGPAATNKMLQEVVRFGGEMVDAVGKRIGSDPKALNLVRDIVPQIEVQGTVAKVSKEFAAAAWTFALLKGAGAGTIKSSAAADALQNIEEGNLSTIAEEFGFATELAKYFNSKVGRDASAEKRLEARMKNAFEGMGLASVFSLIFAGVKNIKKVGPAAAPLFIGSSGKSGNAQLLENVNSDIPTPDNVGAK